MLRVDLTPELIKSNNCYGDCKRCIFAQILSGLGFQEVWVDETWVRFKVKENLKYFPLTQEAINLISDFDDGQVVTPRTITLIENFNFNENT